MTTNADITIINEWMNPETKEEEYYPTFVKEVHWSLKSLSAVNDKGLHHADTYLIRIPEESAQATGKKYLNYKEYAKTKEPEKYWTIRKKDVLVKGEEIEGGSLKTLANKHADVCVITAYSENLRGCNPHYRIGGE